MVRTRLNRLDPVPSPTQRTSVRCRACLLTILAIQIAIRLTIIWHAGPLTDQGLYGDDSYISHKVAANIAEGKGITQAGEPTNGFQPLYVFLLVPFHGFLDIEQATIASAVLNSIFSVLGSYLVFLILGDLLSARVGLIGAALWVVSEYLTRASLNGLETALANAMMLAVVYAHLRSVRVSCRLSNARAALLGAIMGLALLARFDLGLLLLPLGLDQIRVRATRREFGALASVIVAGGLMIAPWFVWSYVVCGSLTPVSGRASRTISQLYGDPTGPQREPEYFPLGEVPASFYLDNVDEAFRRVVVDSPINIPVRAVTRGSVWACLLWMVGWLAAGWLAGRRCRDGRSLPHDFGILLHRLWYLWVFGVLLAAAYCFYFFAQWHFWRYLTPIVIAMILPTAVCVDRVWARMLDGGWPRRVIPAGVVLAFCVVGGWEHARFFARPEQGIAYRIYQDTVELRSFVTPQMRIGSFESGTLDYFLDVDVINLDGKTNALAHREMVAGRMDRLLDTLGLDYVISSPPLVRDLLMRRGRWDSGRPEVVARLTHNVILKVDRNATRR